MLTCPKFQKKIVDVFNILKLFRDIFDFWGPGLGERVPKNLENVEKVNIFDIPKVFRTPTPGLQAWEAGVARES